MNNQHLPLLILLDLSSAFETVDHDILLKRLSSKFAVSGTARWSADVIRRTGMENLNAVSHNHAQPYFQLFIYQNR